MLAKRLNVVYYFFSAGNEWYWQKEHGKSKGDFDFEYLPGFTILQNRIVPTLPFKLIFGNYDVYIKCITGRFALPITFLVARLLNKPFILWTGIWTRLKTPFHRLFFPVVKLIYLHSDAIVVYGDHVKRYLMSEGVAGEKIFSCTHSVDNDFYSQCVSDIEIQNLRNELGISDQEKIILYLGRLEEIKGLPYLISALQYIHQKNYKLVIAGEGNKKSELLGLVRKLHIQDKVVFTGYIPTNKSLPYYAISDIFVLPSITLPEGKETWGLVVNEAFNQGIPVITTESVGAAAGGLVRDGENGFVVPEKDSLALANRIEVLLDNPELRERMSDNARKIIKHWDNEHMVLAFQNAINFAVKERSS